MIIIRTIDTIFIGVDTHKYTHTACIIDYEATIIKSITFDNKPSAFNDVLKNIKQLTKGKTLIFGLEDINGVGRNLSMFLTTKGYEVRFVHASLGNAYRKSLPSYEKTDDYDAYCNARILKDSYKQLPTFNHLETINQIRLLVSRMDILIKERMAMYNQLHSYLPQVYPTYNTFFSELQTKSALYFFKKYPTVKYLKGVSVDFLLTELKTIAKNTRRSKCEFILDEARKEVVTYYPENLEYLIPTIIEDIENKDRLINEIQARLEPLIEETEIKLHTMPGISIVTAARLISIIGDINRFKSHNQLAKYAGIAPVTIASASYEKKERSQGGHRELRSIFYFVAVGMISTAPKSGTERNPLFRSYYLKKLNEGKTKKQALTFIMRQLVKIVYYMIKNKTEYQQPE